MPYTLGEIIGKGGMGCVYDGLTPDGQRTAIKMLECQYVSMPDFREFFDIEARALREMNHPSVVKIMGDPFSDSHGNLYLPMEYVEGETIEHRVKHHGPFSETEARATLCKILSAFTYIHGQQKIHRDIKPSNIMLRPNGEVCIIDFGIAKDMKTPTGKTLGRCVGTDGYMSPEQVKGNSIDYRTDIYSLGCLLHYMLTGQHAIVKQSNDYQTIAVILNKEFPSARQIRPELSDDIQQIIYKAVDKNMLLRYQTASEFRNALMGTPEQDDGGHTTRTAVVSISVGRRNCDITIPNDYVSSKHLTIHCRCTPQGGTFLELEDHSTNGTGVNGRYVHNSSITIPFDITSQYTQETPQILLAGREEVALDFNKVTALLQQRWKSANNEKTTGRIKTDTDSGGTTTKKQVTPPSTPDNLNIGLTILSLVFPIVGWVIWGLWKNEKPVAAQKAATMAWIGFSINIIIQIISII